MNIFDEDLISVDQVGWLSKNGVCVSILRLDKIHSEVSGNKWYKLKYYINKAVTMGCKTLVTYGGAYSNHLIATAVATRLQQLNSIGIVRGEKPATLSHTLQHCIANGMELVFISREDYKNKVIPSALNKAGYYFIPEGGFGVLGAKGAATIPYNQHDFDMVCCAAGTGTMLAGLINAKGANTKVMGFSVLKNNYGLATEIKSLLLNPSIEININHDFHFGGYAKYNTPLINFMNELYMHTGIPTDFVYTAKMIYGVKHLIDEGLFKAGSRILMIQSGGLQGNQSLRKGTLIF